MSSNGRHTIWKWARMSSNGHHTLGKLIEAFLHKFLFSEVFFREIFFWEAFFWEVFIPPHESGGRGELPPWPPGSAVPRSDTAHNSANEMEVVKDMFPSLGLTNF